MSITQWRAGKREQRNKTEREQTKQKLKPSHVNNNIKCKWATAPFKRQRVDF